LEKPAALADLVGPASDARSRMDRMYRHQRHIYNLTRKFYLLGRDALLADLPATPGSRICELGCGTGRNLIRLAQRRREVELYGVDVSSEMLATARARVTASGLDRRIRLAESPAESVDPQRHFGVAGFDVVYFSYVLSMVPGWRRAVERAQALLRPGGTLAIVDFADQSGASALRRRLLLGWLALFDVHPRAEIERDLVGMAARRRCRAPRVGGARLRLPTDVPRPRLRPLSRRGRSG
jgi:S-adenosylmethionine-diacylgycerolhomoserine-N-methlytransferase